MKVALFVPCYIDQFYPQVAISSLELLEKLGVEVHFPSGQTCCGQPMANSGCETDAEGASKVYIKNFGDYDYVVASSGSCVLHIRDHLHGQGEAEESVAKHLRENTYELCQFLTDVLKVKELDASFPHKVGVHISCHGQRGLRLAQSSELVAPPFSKMQSLLQMVKELELIELARKDECCGFGGTFAVSEEAVSVKMGKDRIKDHHQQGAEVITGGDVSCLMHLEGLLKRQKSSIQVRHISQILNGNPL